MNIMGFIIDAVAQSQVQCNNSVTLALFSRLKGTTYARVKEEGVGTLPGSFIYWSA